MRKLTQAVILAGGAGKRLHPFTLTLPKPLFPIGRKPFLEHLIELLKFNNIKQVVILTGYLGEKIKHHFKDGSKLGIHMVYSHLPLYNKKGGEIESGKRLKHAKDLLDEEFLLLYSDNYWPMDLKKMYQHYRQIGTLGQVTVYNNKTGLSEYGFENNIWVSDKNLVQIYDPTRKHPALNAVDIGFFIFNKKATNLLPQKNSHIGQDLLSKLIEQNQLAAFKTDHRYYYITSLASTTTTKKFLKPKKVIFLDRDGVINKKIDGGYVLSQKNLELIPDHIKALSKLAKHGYHFYIITNQRAIAKKLLSKTELKKIHLHMTKQLRKQNIKIKKIYVCPHEQGSCECRKPKPGLLIKASDEHHINLTQSIFIGDSKTDLMAGKAVGCTTYLIDKNTTLLQIAETVLKSHSQK